MKNLKRNIKVCLIVMVVILGALFYLKALNNNDNKVKGQLVEMAEVENTVEVSQKELNAKLLKMAKVGNTVEVSRLLKLGAGVNARNHYDGTALHLASRNRHIDVVKLLLEKGADVNAKDNYDRTALHEANSYGWTKVVKLLIEKGAGVNDEDQ